jgi:hypothetical protein
LTAQDPGEVRFRYFGWEGDTVYEQLRPLNFPDWKFQLQRVEATDVLAQFGQSESFGGKEALPQFIEAYERLLDQFERDREVMVVLLSPTPFEKMPPPLPDLSWRNRDLKAYVDAIRELAKRRGSLFVDLFTPFEGKPGLNFTRNGMHLNARGHWLAASEICRQLGMGRELPEMMTPSDDGNLPHPAWERLRETIGMKNQFWFDYWRPMNWAFLAGDRIEQPSSRDHRDLSVRWFPEELEEFLPLIQEKEKEISSLAAGLPGLPE